MRAAILWAFVCFVGFVLATPIGLLTLAAAGIEYQSWLPLWWSYGVALSLSVGALKALTLVRRQHHSAKLFHRDPDSL